MADSLPAGALQEIENASAAWLHAHGLEDRREVEGLTSSLRQEFRQLISRTEERWLDAGHGTCVLSDPACRHWVIETLHAFDGLRYALDVCAIMPNHVHVLVQPMDGHLIAEIAASWKKFSALRINRILGREGAFWQKETFDHIVRDRAQFDRFRRYIADNPKKARLRNGEYYVGNGSGIA